VDIKPVPKTNDHNSSAKERANFHDKGKKKTPEASKPPAKEQSTPDVSSQEQVDSQILDSAKVLELLATTPQTSHSQAEFAKIAGKVSGQEIPSHLGAKKLNKTL
jgi:hypothetical protein